MGALCYFNRGDGPCHPASGVNIHPVASYFLSSPLQPQPKAYLAERNKLVLPPADKFPAGVAFKDLSQAQLQHYMKESAQILSEKIAYKSAEFGRGSPSSKPKVFTCEVCGKASRAPPPPSRPRRVLRSAPFSAAVPSVANRALLFCPLSL